MPQPTSESHAGAVPLVSCLCVTQDRPEFLPWLLWNYDRQNWSNKELVIVDSSERPFSTDRADVRVIVAIPGTGIAAKRNRALFEARGDYLAWFDDDDWQHPDRLAAMWGLLNGDSADVAGCTSAWFVDLWKRRCAPYHPTGEIIFNSCLFRTGIARSALFDERLRRASDTPWMSAIKRSPGARIATLQRQTCTCWLCHDTNVSNPRSHRRCVLPLEMLRQNVGSGWGATERELDELRLRLGWSKEA